MRGRMRKLLLVASLAATQTAWGNGGGYVYGSPSNGALGLFQPKNAQQVEMQTEDLQIDLHLEFGRVQVEYTLHNPGKAVTAEIGFPCKAAVELSEGEDGKISEGEVTPPLRDFVAHLDGERVEVRVIRDKVGRKDLPAPDVRGETGPLRHVPYWYTFKLDFAANQTRKLRVTYDTDYYGYMGGVSDDTQSIPETLTYLFSTAAVWKGAIKTGKVTINAVGVPADQVKLNLSKRFKRQGNQWTWEFKDFEPGLGDDLQIAAHPAEVTFGRPLPGSKPPGDNEEIQYVDFVERNGRWAMYHRDFDVTASSTLAAQGENNYEAKNVADNDPETAWVEGAKGDGVGEKLELKLRTPRKISHIGIRNGYARQESATAYLNNSRPAELGISVNGSAPFTVAIPDERLTRHKFQIPIPDAPEVKTITLTIQKVYPGNKFQDTCISDLELVTPLEKKPAITPAR